MNELLWLLMLMLNFFFIMTAFRLWGKAGLFVWMAISVIVANIQVTKNVLFVGIEATLGNIVYATSFLATDILSEFYGPGEARKAVGIGFFSLISMTVLMQVALLFSPSESDIAQQSLAGIFGLMPRIAGASLIAYLASNLHDIFAFEFWKKRTKALWIRNNLSTIVSQTIDSLIFTIGAFAGIYSASVLWQIFITTLLLKWVVAICDTPFIYLARKWMTAGLIEDSKKTECKKTECTKTECTKTESGTDKD